MGQRAGARARDSLGWVYLIHFDDPLVGVPGDGFCRKRGTISPNPPEKRKTQVAGHYLGWTDNVQSRMEEHLRSDPTSARLILEANRRGLSWRLVRTWVGTRGLETKLRRRKQNRQLCPVCQAAHRARERRAAKIRRLSKLASLVACATT